MFLPGRVGSTPAHNFDIVNKFTADNCISKFSETENSMIQMDSSFCTECAGVGAGKFCGGDYGAISVYPNFPAHR